jgi:acyl-CoA thioester hydrolase
MSYKFSTEIRVRLPETDAMGIVFHGYFFTYFDVARMDYLRNLHLVEAFGTGRGANLIVHASAEFRSPARFDDVLAVQSRVSRIGNTSLTFEFRVAHRPEGRIVAEGRSVHVMIDPATWKPVRVPEEIRRGIRAFEGTDLVEEG